VPGEPRAHTHVPPVKGSLCSQPLPAPATPVFLVVEKQPGSEGSLLPEQPWGCAAGGAAHPVAALLPARRTLPTSGPGVGVVPGAAETPSPARGAARMPDGQPGAFLLRSVRSLF